MPAVLIVVYIFVEVMATSEFSSAFGGGMLFLEFLVSGFIGLGLIKSTGSHMGESLRELRSGNINPRDLMTSAISRIVGGVLLFLPGVLSDIFGIVIQLSQQRFSKKSDNNQEYRRDDNLKTNQNDDIIDVEVVDKELK